MNTPAPFTPKPPQIQEIKEKKLISHFSERIKDLIKNGTPMEEVFKAVNDSLHELEIRSLPPAPKKLSEKEKLAEGYESLIKAVFSMEELGFHTNQELIQAMRRYAPRVPFKTENIGPFLAKTTSITPAHYYLHQIRAYANKGYFQITDYDPKNSSIAKEFPARLVTREGKFIYVKPNHQQQTLSFLLKPLIISPISIHDPALFTNPDRMRHEAAPSTHRDW